MTPKRPRGVVRAFKFLLLPNAGQKKQFEVILSDCCETYNAAIQERREAWKLCRTNVTYVMQQAQLTALREEERFRNVACDIQRDPLRRVERSFKAFFRRCKTGEKPGHPRFKSRARYNSFSWGNSNVRTTASRIRVPNVGLIRMRGGRPLAGKPLTATIKKDGNRWWLSVVCELGAIPSKRTIGASTGLDVGISALVTLSNGTSFENPRWVRKHEARIAAASRRLATKKRRSLNRLKAKELLRRAHQRAANARTNHLHHISKLLVKRYDLIAHEDLRIRNMVRLNLAKGILDAAWAQLIWQITYKAESAGAWVVPVNPCGTSQRCSGCGETVKKELSERVHRCACGLTLDRDHNAALNILALGVSAVGLAASAVNAEMAPIFWSAEALDGGLRGGVRADAKGECGVIDCDYPFIRFQISIESATASVQKLNQKLWELEQLLDSCEIIATFPWNPLGSVDYREVAE